jgi:hypothetical protein
MLPRTLWRGAIVFFAIAQVVLAFAPLVEGRFGPDARAHVERDGTNIHHAHNDADCTACTVRHLLDSKAIFHDISAATTRSRAPPALV